MNSSRLLYLILLTLQFFSACDKIEQRHNAPEDIEEAKQFAKGFYTRIAKLEFDKAAALFGGQEVAAENADKFLRDVYLSCDTLINAEAYRVETKVRIIEKRGKTPSIKKEYIVEVDAEYKNRKYRETITLRNTGDTLKIEGYNQEWNNH